MVAERTGTPPHSQVKLSGIIPPLADSFHQRPETGLDLRAGLYPGDTVVLTHGEVTDAAPAAQGGTGKTQLAVAFAHALWGARTVDALVWVPATSQEAGTSMASIAALWAGWSRCLKRVKARASVRHWSATVVRLEKTMMDVPPHKAQRTGLKSPLAAG